MIERMEVSRPPGVFMVIRIRLACCSLAWSIPRTMYSARIGSISPSIRNSTTLEFAEGGDCVPAGEENASDNPSAMKVGGKNRRSERKDIPHFIIARDLAYLMIV